MAVNQDASIENSHTAYVAMSGYGKSQALKQNKSIPARGVRVLLWDVDEDHKAHHYDRRGPFFGAVLAAMKSGSGFRIAWSGQSDVKTFEWFCGIAWQCLDGNRPLFIIIEELADVSPSSGKATNNCGQLFRRARKYNGQIHWTTQRSQEVPKTAYSQSAIKYIGYPDETCSPGNAEELGRIAGTSGKSLYDLQPLQFYRRANKKTELLKLSYKN